MLDLSRRTFELVENADGLAASTPRISFETGTGPFRGTYSGSNMSKKPAKKWKLNPNEVTGGFDGLSSGKSGQFERKLKVTGSTMFLKHIPTGITVEGEVPSGHMAMTTLWVWGSVCSMIRMSRWLKLR